MTQTSQILARLAEHRGRGVEAERHRVEWPGVGRRSGHAGEDPLAQDGRPPEEHLALVGEVPEEGALGQPGALGDLRGGGLVEAAFGEQCERGLLQTASAVRFPSTHASSLPGVDSH